MSSHLSVKIGPFARCRYEGRRPDISEITCERMWDVDGESPTKGVMHVMSNRPSEHTKHFDRHVESSIAPLDKAARVDAVAWFVETFAHDLEAIADATGHTPEVLWGIVAVYQ